ncbi:hypothetical protein D7W82_12295 [Corallococcus sp. CA049B]|uniref:hypothetical protein n=1 Tax=Corallococcus sp. CA049B TaxID=2316730 RepID=UPI000EA112AE|nr:hypothetical protein [Corallococcus sp. CA049B]NOJ91426.1 hypothetical protein [Corallococcus coralloides]RKG87839.1 hypothetical protein D7W82_12295 [Corallococcus sp. CA049B]
MHMRIIVGLLAGGLMLGCGGVESDATTGDERTVQAQGAMADEFEVKADVESGVSCNPEQRKLAEEHMVKNHSSFAKMGSCELVAINYQLYIRYTYYY